MVSTRIGKEQCTGHRSTQAGPGRLPAGSGIEAETVRRSCQPGEVGGSGVLEEAGSPSNSGCAHQMVGGFKPRSQDFSVELGVLALSHGSQKSRGSVVVAVELEASLAH